MAPDISQVGTIAWNSGTPLPGDQPFKGTLDVVLDMSRSNDVFLKPKLEVMISSAPEERTSELEWQSFRNNIRALATLVYDSIEKSQPSLRSLWKKFRKPKFSEQSREAATAQWWNEQLSSVSDIMRQVMQSSNATGLTSGLMTDATWKWRLANPKRTTFGYYDVQGTFHTRPAERNTATDTIEHARLTLQPEWVGTNSLGYLTTEPSPHQPGEPLDVSPISPQGEPLDVSPISASGNEGSWDYRTVSTFDRQRSVNYGQRVYSSQD